MAERLRPRTLDLEVQGPSLAHCIVYLDKELYSSPGCINGYQRHTAGEGGTLRGTSNPARGV